MLFYGFGKGKIVSKVRRGSEIAGYQVLVVIFNVTVPHSWIGNRRGVTGGCRWSTRKLGGQVRPPTPGIEQELGLRFPVNLQLDIQVNEGEA